MAWDFETEPEFQRELDWMDAFVREEVEPLDLVLGTPADKNEAVMRIVRPLQDQVKERGQIVATGGGYISPGVADITNTQLLFEGSVRAHVFVSWLHPFKEQKLVVIGSKRMVSFDDVAKQMLMWNLEVDWQQGQPIPVKHDGVAIDYGEEEPLREECRHFLDCIEGRRAPRTDGHSGVYVLQLLHAAQRSIDGNGERIAVGRGVTRPGDAAGP